MPRFSRAAIMAMGVFAGACAAYAQRGAGDWTTSGYDAQRSFWVRNDGKISRESMGKPGFELVWKLKLNNTARQLSSITPPVLLDFYISYRGFRTLGFLGTSSGGIVGIDTDLGRTEWEKSFPAAGAGAGSILCPGGMTSAVTRPTTIVYPPVPTGRGLGRGNPAKSGVGEPYEGAVTLKPAPAKPAVTPPPAPAPTGSAAATTRRVTTPPNPFAPSAQYVHGLTADGKFHSLYVSNGESPKPAVQFLPPNANAQGLTVFDGHAYASTSNSCGGVENGVWALNLESAKVNSWKAEGSVAGSAGVAVGPDGTIYAASGSRVIALEEGTLKPKGSHTTGQQRITSSPVVFEYKGKDLIAVTSQDGSIHLFDAASPGNVLTSTPAGISKAQGGALSSWQDPTGTRWILAAAERAIEAWQVLDQNGAPALRQGWRSAEIVAPLSPIIVNGVIFAAASGEYRSNDPKVTAAERAKRSSHAILYALDAATGKELWNSGRAISSFATTGGLSAGGARVYIGTHDGTQYAFGFPIEH